MGTYKKVEDRKVFTSTIYKEKSKEMYLFSIHPLGRVWTIGKGMDIDSETLARIDFKKYNPELCPHHNDDKDWRWEIIQSNNSHNEEFYHDVNLIVQCTECFENYILCNKTGDCVPYCDGTRNCDDGSDEDEENCKALKNTSKLIDDNEITLLSKSHVEVNFFMIFE